MQIDHRAVNNTRCCAIVGERGRMFLILTCLLSLAAGACQTGSLSTGENALMELKFMSEPKGATVFYQARLDDGSLSETIVKLGTAPMNYRFKRSDYENKLSGAYIGVWPDGTFSRSVPPPFHKILSGKMKLQMIMMIKPSEPDRPKLRIKDGKMHFQNSGLAPGKLSAIGERAG